MKKLLFLLIFTIILLLILSYFWGVSPDKPNYEYAPDMARSEAFQTQTPNPFLPNGQTQQSPVKGTVPQNYQPLHFDLTEKDFIRAGRELLNPHKKPDDYLKRGEKIYRIFCQVCHGASGKGNGRVVQRGYPPPPSLLADRSKKLKDGQIFYVITYGFKNMPSYSSQIERDDRWSVIDFIRKLQESQP